jgi:hypothetical protein
MGIMRKFKRSNEKKRKSGLAGSGSRWYKLWRIGARIAHSVWALKCGAQWGLGNETVLHVDAHALLIHPAFSIIRVACKVRGIFLSRRHRPVISLVRPKLISASAEKEEMTLEIFYSWEGPRQNVPASIVPAFAPLVHWDWRGAYQILVIESYTCGHECSLATRSRF